MDMTEQVETNDFERWVAALQEAILERERTRFSARLLAEARQPHKLARMAEGKSLAEAAAIDAAEVIVALDGLPAEHVHCATLAVSTLQQAIADCRPQGAGRGE
jgi:hypothetical protein